jgi:serine/threonine protein kinase
MFQMELYSLLSPSTAGMSPAPAPSSSMIDGVPEIGSSNVRYVEVMGEGQFGKVWRGELVGYTTTTTTSSSDDGGGGSGPATTQVAMKALREDAKDRHRMEFEHEVKIKANLKHPNVVELIGVSCMSSPSYSPASSNAVDLLHPTTPCMIFEYMYVVCIFSFFGGGSAQTTYCGLSATSLDEV